MTNMSRLQTIENRLKEINGTVFQELCEQFKVYLLKQENESDIK